MDLEGVVFFMPLIWLALVGTLHRSGVLSELPPFSPGHKPAFAEPKLYPARAICEQSIVILRRSSGTLSRFSQDVWCSRINWSKCT